MRNSLRFIIAMAVLALGACNKDPLVVKTEAGLVRGFYEEGMLLFRSIPYMKAERLMGRNQGLPEVSPSGNAVGRRTRNA